MADWLARLGDRVDRLPERDRRMLYWGAPVILVLVLYLLAVQPLLSRYQTVAASHDRLRADLVWLLEQREHLERVNSFCSLAIEPVARSDAEFVITGQARRMGLNPRMQSQGVDGFRLEADSADGNAVLALSRELACRGVSLNALEIRQSAPDNTRVEASLELRLP